MTAAATRLRRRALPWGATAVALVLAGAPAAAWSPTTQRAIALEAARRAPAPWNAQLVRHAEDLMAGAVEPFSERDPARHLRNADGRGHLDRVVREEVEAALAAAAGRSWSALARQLGRLSHYAADANFPLNASADDPAERRYFADYALYAESARTRFVLVSYAAERTPADAAAVDRLVADALTRSRRLYPAVGREYRRIDWATGRERFDDRSTAFAAASLGYSHAVSDVARLLRYVAARAPRQPVEIRLAAHRTGTAGASD